MLQSLNMEGVWCHPLTPPPVGCQPLQHVWPQVLQVPHCTPSSTRAQHAGDATLSSLAPPPVPTLPPAVGIEMAQKDGVDWLLHVDTDELIHPSGSPDFSLQVGGSLGVVGVLVMSATGRL